MWTPRCFFTSETSAQSKRELIRAPYFQSATRDQQAAAQVKKSTQSTPLPYLIGAQRISPGRTKRSKPSQRF